MRRFFATLLVFSLLINSVGCNNISTIKEINLPTRIIEPVVDRNILSTNNPKSSIFQEQSSREQVMGWIIINYLSPYMEESLKNYYGGNVPYWLTDPTSQVLEANFVEDKSYFIVKLQVEPYLGAHNPIGLDNFTFKINLPNNKVTLEKYEHVKSFKVPDHLNLQ